MPSSRFQSLSPRHSIRRLRTALALGALPTSAASSLSTPSSLPSTPLATSCMPSPLTSPLSTVDAHAGSKNGYFPVTSSEEIVNTISAALSHHNGRVDHPRSRPAPVDVSNSPSAFVPSGSSSPLTPPSSHRHRCWTPTRQQIRRQKSHVELELEEERLSGGEHLVGALIEPRPRLGLPFAGIEELLHQQA